MAIEKITDYIIRGTVAPTEMEGTFTEGQIYRYESATDGNVFWIYAKNGSGELAWRKSAANLKYEYDN